MSFYTSLSGLQGAQTDLSAISHNLANVGTNGFKRSRVEFGDVIASSTTSSPNQQIGSGAVVKGVNQQFSQGGIQQSASALDLAISGEGFFAMRRNANSAEMAFTRNGAFTVNADRFVVDSQGAYLQVYPVDGSGNVVATGLDQTINLQLPQTSGSPVPTSTVALSLNMPANGEIPSQNPVYDAANPYAFDRFDPDSYNHSTTTIIYDSTGSPISLTNYYTRETSPTAGDPTSDWTVYSFVGDQQLSTNLDPTQPAEPLTITFDASGALVSPTAATPYATFTPLGANAQDVTIDYSLMTTQRPTAFSLSSFSQDGVPVGQLEGVTVNNKGLVEASFSNGETIALGKVVIAGFPNPGGLRQLGNSYWQATGISGAVRAGEAGVAGLGNLMSGAIERSNVDITEELVGLIAAQRNFQANAKAIDTANTLSQTIINIRN